MAVIVILPKQGQSVESCIITEIKKKKGDKVSKGDVLFAYETDKASFEEESPADGVVLECFHNEGDEVPVLMNMMVIGELGEDFAGLPGEVESIESRIKNQEPRAKSQEPGTKSQESRAKNQEVEVENKEQRVKSKDSETENQESRTKSQDSGVGASGVGDSGVGASGVGVEGKGEQFVSPRAKHLAAREVVDVNTIAGSGPKGRVIERDVQAALESRPKMTPLAKKIAAEEGLQPQGAGSGLAGTAKASDLLPPPVNATYGIDYEDKKLSNMRKIIAKSMHASLQNSAQLTHHLGADARNIQNLRRKAKKAFEAGSLSTNLTINDFVCFAVVKALKKFPNVNSHFLGDAMRLFGKVHLGLAVDTERGLMVPAVRNADDLSIIGLANQMKEVANSCKKGAISPELLAAEAATFTVSNLGNYGVEMFTPVINLPQSAILGVNTIVPRPKDLGDGVYGFVPYLGLSLTYDHRALDGGEATRFLKQIAIEIETLEIDLL